MIYVTVGTQLAFSRLATAVNEWAEKTGTEVFVQKGPDKTVYSSVKSASFVSPSQADQLMRDADLVVAHAGMGTILTASQYGKRLIVMPRQFSFGEHRNDHQVATAKRFCDFPNITVVQGTDELFKALEEFSNDSNNSVFVKSSEYAPEGFINALKELLKL